MTAEGRLKAPKITVIGGLESFQVGFDKLEGQLVKAEKLVMKVVSHQPHQ